MYTIKFGTDGWREIIAKDLKGDALNNFLKSQKIN